MRYLLLLVLLPFSLHSQPKITLTGPAVRPGSPATLTVTLSGSPGAAALQWFTTAVPGMVVTPGAALAAGKTAVCAVVGGLFGCVASGGSGVIPDGVLATVTFPAPVAAASFPLSNMVGSNPAGDSPGIPIASGVPFTLPLLSACDLNGDGRVDTLDARNVIDQIEGVIPATTDLNGDGKTNVLDLQRVTNAAADGVCRVGA